jgi:hypothetical protein
MSCIQMQWGAWYQAYFYWLLAAAATALAYFDDYREMAAIPGGTNWTKVNPLTRLFARPAVCRHRRAIAANVAGKRELEVVCPRRVAPEVQV